MTLDYNAMLHRAYQLVIKEDFPLSVKHETLAVSQERRWNGLSSPSILQIVLEVTAKLCDEHQYQGEAETWNRLAYLFKVSNMFTEMIRAFCSAMF
jgi:hypothetical protein